MAVLNAEAIIGACGTKEHVLSAEEIDALLAVEKEKNLHKVTQL